MKNSKTGKLRIAYIAVFVLLMLVEVLIALFVHDSFVRPYGGDIIVIAVLYCAVRIIFPEGLRLLPLYLFIFACCIEFAQAADYVTLLGLGDSTFFRTLLGTSFAWEDILCYAAGSLICLAYQLAFVKKRK